MDPSKISSGNGWNKVLGQLTDAHCHPTDAYDGEHIPQIAAQISRLCTAQVCVMSSSLQSQSKTEDLFNLQPDRVVPAFGLHPWFTPAISITGNLDKFDHYSSLLECKPKQKNHLAPTPPSELGLSKRVDLDQEKTGWIRAHLDLLPAPITLDRFLADLRSGLARYPNSIVGEIGLDKAFKFQLDRPSSPSEQQHEQKGEGGDHRHDQKNRLKTDFKISIAHQLVILKAQIDLAIELSRPISLHCVQAPNELLGLFETLSKQWGARFTGIQPDAHPGSSKKNLKTGIEKYPSNGDGPDPLPVQFQKHQAQRDLQNHEQGCLLNRFKICWHSPNISCEVLQRTLRLLPTKIYFSYSSDLAILFDRKPRPPGSRPEAAPRTARKEAGDAKDLGIGEWKELYSSRVTRLIGSTPRDRLLVETDDGSDPSMIDQKLVKIIKLIAAIHQDPDSNQLQKRTHPPPFLGLPPVLPIDLLAGQLQSNWNIFYSSHLLPP